VVLWNGLTRNSAIRLRHEYQEALKEDKIAGSAILNGLIHCAAKECLQLANLMYRKLPTELRDLVYRFLCIEDRAIPVGPYYHFRPYDHTRIESPDHALAMGLARGRSLDDHRNKPDPALLMPDSHIFNQTYMGQDVTSEAVKTYLTNNTFSICDVEDGISRFLGGAFGTHSPTCGHRMFPNGSTQIAADYGESPIAVRFDLIQPRDYVRKLQVRIKHEQYYHYLERTSPSLLDMFADECHSLRHAKNALRPLQHLPQCTQPLELEFIIVAGGAARQESRRFINFLQALRNTFYALMYDRENTTIKIIHHDENISPFPRDITLLWSLTKEQWEQVSIGLSVLISI
jgi:hypothetical protein